MMKKLRYALEYLVLRLAFWGFGAIPPKAASTLGGMIGQTIGPLLATSRKARTNLALALPGRPPSFYPKTIKGMWNNLGRVIAEYPHLKSLIEQAEIIGKDHLDSLPPHKPYIVIGGHLGNWEMLPWLMNDRINRPVDSIYRAPNNPEVAKLLNHCRNPDGRFVYVPKSLKGSRQLISTLQNGRPIALLIDQKFNQGLSVPFFGRPAKTSPSFIQLARKYDCPIVPIWVQRVSGTQMRLIIDPPFTVQGEESDEDILSRVHGRLEDIIRHHPGQWLWLHRRWVEQNSS